MAELKITADESTAAGSPFLVLVEIEGGPPGGRVTVTLDEVTPATAPFHASDDADLDGDGSGSVSFAEVVLLKAGHAVLLAVGAGKGAIYRPDTHTVEVV